MEEDLLSLLRYELGEVVDWEELCPSVYYLGVQPNPDSIYPCSEYYLVLPGAPISQEALALGRPLDGVPGLLYAIDPSDEGGWTAIMYELCKNRFRHGIPPLEGWSLIDAAMEGMELCPSYFGLFPVPPYTPWGWTLRHKVLDNGVYWLETSQYKTALAVCHPIWSPWKRRRSAVCAKLAGAVSAGSVCVTAGLCPPMLREMACCWQFIVKCTRCGTVPAIKSLIALLISTGCFSVCFMRLTITQYENGCLK